MAPAEGARTSIPAVTAMATAATMAGTRFDPPTTPCILSNLLAMDPPLFCDCLAIVNLCRPRHLSERPWSCNNVFTMRTGSATVPLTLVLVS